MVAETGQASNGRFHIHRLPNGLQMVGEVMPAVESISACFYVNTGARDEPKEIMGVSHFLEHMMFKGTATRDYRAINHAFEEMGAENNAGTWLEFTYYWAKVLSDQSPKLIELLADMMRPRLDEDDFNQERNVILEEIARYEDIPNFKLFEHLQEQFFGDHPLSFQTLGTNETISALPLPLMRAYHERRYAPNNMIFSIAGKFDWPTVVAQVEQLTSGWGQGEAGRTANAWRPQPVQRIYHRPDLQQQLIAIASQGIGRSDPDRYVADLLAMVLGDAAGSRLYWGIREAGLAESAAADSLTFDGTGLYISSATTTPELAPTCYQALQHELERFQEDGVTEEELQRAKIKLTSRVVMDGESTNRRMLALVDSWLSNDRLETLEEVVAQIDVVSVADVRRLLDRLPLTASQVVVAMGPVEEAVLFGR